jgi:hypothetical protein
MIRDDFEETENDLEEEQEQNRQNFKNQNIVILKGIYVYKIFR